METDGGGCQISSFRGAVAFGKGTLNPEGGGGEGAGVRAEGCGEEEESGFVILKEYWLE